MLRKLFMGPVQTVKCRSCGKRLGVPWSALWTLIPFFAGTFVADHLEAPALRTATFLGGIALMCVIYVGLVSLEARP